MGARSGGAAASPARPIGSVRSGRVAGARMGAAAVPVGGGRRDGVGEDGEETETEGAC